MIRLGISFIISIIFVKGESIDTALANQTSSVLEQSYDTTIVAKVISEDSVLWNNHIEYSGIKYYYGVHHINLQLINVADNDKLLDTITVAYVYNMFYDKERYFDNFGLRKGKAYLFYATTFTPCHSDFPRLQGQCDIMGNFYPVSNECTQKYRRIYRIIFATEYKGRRI